MSELKDAWKFWRNALCATWEGFTAVSHLARSAATVSAAILSAWLGFAEASKIKNAIIGGLLGVVALFFFEFAIRLFITASQLHKELGKQNQETKNKLAKYLDKLSDLFEKITEIEHKRGAIPDQEKKTVNALYEEIREFLRTETGADKAAIFNEPKGAEVPEPANLDFISMCEAGYRQNKRFLNELGAKKKALREILEKLG